MKKLAALITAVVLILSTCAVGASAAEYGRNPEHSEITAQGENIYYFEDGAIWEFNIVSGKKRTVCKTENAYYICVIGNYLYYYSFSYTKDYVYKVDIGSGKKTKILDCDDSAYEIFVESLITSGNKIYIGMREFIHDEVNDMYYVDIYDTNGKYLDNFTPCIESYSFFIDASGCEACAAAKEGKIIYTYDEDGDEVDWSAEYTGTYNIVKIKSDFSEEKITIPAKVGKNVNRFVYCGEEYVYYIDNNDRLCRYNTKTEKFAVLVDGGVWTAHYKDGVVYFFTTNGNELKKYENGSISVIQKIPSKGFFTVLYFFDEYMLYYNYGTNTYKVIDYSGKELISVDLNQESL